MNIPQKIDDIIAERKKWLPEIDAAIARLNQAQEAVDKLTAFRRSADPNREELADVLARLELVSTESFERQYQIAMDSLKDLRRRFSRDEVRISFVGRAGQGKSLVMQRISGLPGTVIPSAEGSDCTGARSIISNRPGSPTQAQITFYTQQELLGIVNQYLERIFGPGMFSVYHVDDISRLKKRGLREQLDCNDRDYVHKSAFLEHLEKYIDHVDGVKGVLGTNITVPEEQIEQYVAQYNSRNNQQKYYTYLIVKEANIMSSFPCEQCGKIVLVDTIGTGATSLGVEEAMLETVKRESDAIVLMMRPDPVRARITAEDNQLVTDISNAVSREYAEKMLFLVLNRVEQGNGRNSHHIPDMMVQINRWDRPIARCLNVNCWEEEEVQERLLIPILECMADQLNQIDRLLIDRVNKTIERLREAYGAISRSVEGISLSLVEADMEYEFYQNYIRPTIDRMTSQLRRLYVTYHQEKNGASDVLRQDAAQKLQNLYKWIPEPEEVRELLEREGALNPHNILEKLANRSRIQIIDDFLTLNAPMHELAQKLKAEVVQILSSEDGGRLGFVISGDSDKPDQWLESFREKFEENKSFRAIRSALEPLISFDLRMENFLIYKVRSCLSPLDWSEQSRLDYDFGEALGDVKKLTDHICFWFNNNMPKIHLAISKELEGYYSFAGTALYAVARDFYDRSVHAENGMALEQWRYLYSQKFPMIWPEDYRKYLSAQGVSETVSELVNAVQACAGAEYFLIK